MLHIHTAKDYDPKKSLTAKDRKKIIPNIAKKWKDIGIELGVRHLDTYQGLTDLNEEKFKRMLALWININPKPIDELFDIFCEGLKGINLNRAAVEFKGNIEKFKEREALKKLA